MRLRLLLCLIGMAGFFISSAVQALGLGEITVKSQLNEPLNAEIRLLKVDDLSKEEILVFLASRDDFARAGVDRLFFLNDLRFDVFLSNRAYPHVRVTSTKPVTEPYLNFLVDVQWPTGRLVREYTLLLDLPTFVQDTAPAPVQAPAATPSQPPASAVTPAQPRPQSTRPSVTPAPAQQAPSTADRSIATDSYRVQSGDTLWEIAARSRPSNSVSVNQTMLAIQRVNPDAFTANNINLIQSGRVLRIPSESEINQISFNSATQEVQAQNRVWSGESANANEQAALTSSSPANTSTGAAVAQPEGRLTLGAADSGSAAAQGSGSSASGSALQNELASAQEELDRSTLENNELKSRITDLEEQIQTMEQLINISNDQLRALELSLEQQKDLATEQVPAIDTPSDITAPTEIASEIEATLDEPVFNEQVTEAPVVETIPPVSEELVFEEPVFEEPAIEEPVIAEPPSIDEPGIIDLIKEKWQIIAAAIGGLLLVVLLALKLRKSKENDDIDAFEYEEGNDFIESDDIETEEDDLGLEPVDAVEEADLEDDIQAETEDVIAEADIYISLGQEDKAIELLQKEVQHNPGNAEARLGLLGIYASAQSVEAFDDQYAQLLPLGDNYAIEQAKQLRTQMADATPFDEDSYSLDLGEPGIDDLAELDLSDTTSEDITEESVIEPLDELDLDLDLDIENDAATTATTQSVSELDDLDLDLDLELDDSELLDNAAEVANELADTTLDVNDLDSELDLDLDLDENTLSETAEAANEFELSLDNEIDELDLDLELDLDSSADGLLDEIAEAADVDDAGLASELDGAVDELDELDLDLDLDELAEKGEELVEFDLNSNDAELDSLEKPEMIEEIDLEEVSFEAADSDDLLATEGDDFDELTLGEDVAEGLDALSEELAQESLGSVPVAEDAINALESDELIDSADLLAQEDDLPKDMDFESTASPEELADIDANKLSFDEPPLDLDIDSLDQEIDAMTADFDSDEVEAAPEVSEPLEELSLGEDAQEEITEESQSEITEVVLSEDDDLSFLDETDEVATKLDLARAYLDMGDHEGAQDILEEVLSEGNDTQVDEAKSLLKDM